jgi:hypothetical protein
VSALTEPAALGIGNPCGMTALDLATTSMLGREPRSPLPRAQADVPLDEVLFDVLEPALASGRCLVSFSGGRESSILLAAATSAARSRGHPDPIPATLRYPIPATTRDAKVQESLVARLGLHDWERVEIQDELEIAGPYSLRALREVGALFPPNAYTMLPLLDLAREGWLVTGGVFADFFLYWHWAGLASVLARRRRPRRRDAVLLGAALLPGPPRAAVARRRLRRPPMPWLREDAAREAERRALAEAASVPVRFDQALARQRTHRCFGGAQRSLDALAAAAGARPLMPLRSDRYVAAVAATGGRFGFGDRAESVRRVGGHLVPEEILRRRDDPTIQGVLFRGRSRALVESWTGGGVDPDVVDPAVLHEVWSRETVDWRSSALLQLVAAHEESEKRTSNKSRKPAPSR